MKYIYKLVDEEIERIEKLNSVYTSVKRKENNKEKPNKHFLSSINKSIKNNKSLIKDLKKELTYKSSKPPAGCFICRKSFKFGDPGYCDSCVKEISHRDEKYRLLVDSIVEKLNDSVEEDMDSYLVHYCTRLLKYIKEKMK